MLFLILDIIKASYPNASSDKLKLNLHSIGIMIDTMFDYGYPTIT